MTDDPDPHERWEIDLAEPCPLWREHLPEIELLVGDAARAALAAEAAPEAGGELSLVLGDDALVQALNGRWRGRDAPTNVLSFSAAEASAPPDAPRLLGDVVLAFETVAREAAAQGKPLADHLRHLVVHGVLHLRGFDHEEEDAARRMEALEIAVLAGLGVANPYEMAEASND